MLDLGVFFNANVLFLCSSCFFDAEGFFFMLRFVIPHISVWGSSFVGCHPARIRPSFLPSFFPSFPPSSSLPPPLTRSLARSLSHSLTHSVTHSLTQSLTDSLTHSLTHSHFQASAETSSLTHSLIHTTHSITDETAEGPAVSRDCRRACGARGRRWAGSLRSVQRLQKGLRRARSPLGRFSPQCPETAEGPAARLVAAGPALSTVSRNCRRACGARGRRWAGSLHSVPEPLGRLSPQCPETAEGAAARVVAAGGPALSAVSRDCRRACGARGRRWGPGSLRSVQRLQKGLRRAWSPLGRLSLQWPALSAVSRDCRRGCGARGRRWAGSLRSVQRLQKGLQCPETAEGPAARLVAAGPALQCPETAEGPAALVVAAGPALSAVSRDCRRACGARGRRWGPALSAVSRDCRRDCRRACGARGRRWGPALCAVSRDCRRGCGARGRRWGPGGLSAVARLSPQCPETDRRGCGARGRRWGPGCKRLSGAPQWPALSAVSRDCRRGCGARGRRWRARLSPQWPQCPETAEGAAARVVAAGGPALSSSGRRPQCPETAEGAAARVVAAGGPALSAVADAVSRDCRRVTAARIVMVAAGGPALSAGARLSPQSRDCRRGCGARGRRWGPGSLRSGRRSLQRLQKGLRRAWSPLGAPTILRITAIVICKALVVTGCESHCNGCGKNVAHPVSVHYCHCGFHSIGSRRFGIAL